MFVYVLIYNGNEAAGGRQVVGLFKTEEAAKWGMSKDRDTDHKGALSYAYDIEPKKLLD